MTSGRRIIFITSYALLALAAAAGWTAYYLELNAAQREDQRTSDAQTALSRELAALQTDYENLDRGYQALHGSHRALVEEHDTLRREHCALRARSGQIEARLARTIQERDKLNSRLEKARSEQTRLSDELESMVSERTRLTAELDATQRTQDSLRVEQGINLQRARAKEAEFEGSQQRSQQLNDQRDQLHARLDAAAEKQADLRARLQATNERIGVKESELRDSQRRIEALVTGLDTANAKILGLAAELDSEKAARRRDNERFAQLKMKLEAELENRDVQIERLQDDLTVIRVGGDILFNTGSAELRPAGVKALRLIAQVLHEYPDRDVSLEGHTDDVAIGESLRGTYPSNWELSAARAARAVRFLQIERGIDPRRLRVVGYGEHHPIASNDDPQGKARNRRIEIMLLPRVEPMAPEETRIPVQEPLEQADSRP